ncbi:MAG: hypothetical protein H6832_18475 [Planctomycetes bacterium]|nr:hypothetical protein [Planctomycetota bacterium]MCB9920394.1 hypothetical protein [Planctomycetota bacterium]
MPAIVLLAKPRAGAHGFNSIVRTHPQISVFAEIFHDALVEQEQNFFGFVWQEAERMKQFCMPYHHSRLKIFGEYLEYLETRSKTPRFVIDIKYNVIRHMDGIWKDLLDPPDLLQYFMDYKIPVVHLVRRNVLKVLLSETRAHQTGLWVVRPGQEKPPKVTDVALDGSQIVSQLAQRVLEIDAYDKLLSVGERVHTVIYEELFDKSAGGPYKAEIVSRLASFLELEDRFDGAMDSIKISTGDLTTEISNYSEIEAALRGTVWATLLRNEPIDWPSLVAASK